ncbi:MAG: hypothetical protein HRT45_06905 [Bdellovibrionales bacterium]|nr:hypothetical protein [Bdellovibrionales bacterium]
MVTELSRLRKFFLVLMIVLAANASFAGADEEGTEGPEKAIADTIKNIQLYADSNQYRSYVNALSAARTSSKALLLFVTYEGCGFCPSLLTEMRELMKADTSLNSKVVILPIHLGQHQEVEGESQFVKNPTAWQVLDEFAAHVGTMRNQEMTASELLSGGIPALFMLDPDEPGVMKEIDSGPLELPDDQWTNSGRYHDTEKVRAMMQALGLKALACGGEI